MEVILIEDIPSLGKAGERIKVADGYAKNYLLPRKKAVKATAATIKNLKQEQLASERRQQRLLHEAQQLAQRINEITCTISKAAGEEGKLFGAVTTTDIENALRKHGISIDRKKIVLEEPIKNVGVYTIPIKLHPNVVAELKLWVEKE